MDSLRLKWVKRLYQEFEQISYAYRLKIPKPLLLLSDNQHQLGAWDPLRQAISLSERLILNYPWYVVVEVFKHEIAHYLVDLESDDLNQAAEGPHGPAFLRACRRLGVEAWAQSASIDLGEGLNVDSLYKLDDRSQRMQSRISKLLNLSQSSNEHEAKLAMARARELQRSFNLELGQGAQESSSEFISLLVGLNKKRTPASLSRICSILTKYFFVDVVFVNYYVPADLEDYKGFEILGSLSNVVMAEYVFHYLSRQLDVLWRDYRKREGVQGARYKNSYQLGVLHGFELSLKQQRAESKPSDDATSQSDLIYSPLPAWTQDTALSQYKSKLQSYLGQRYPRLQMRGSSRSRVFGATFAEGSSVGKNLRIRQPLASGTQSFGGYLD